MDMVVVGPADFTLGFQLAGVTRLYNPEDEGELAEILRSLRRDSGVGIVLVSAQELAGLSEQLRLDLSASTTPTFLGIGEEEDTTLRETIKRAIGVDLWKE